MKNENIKFNDTHHYFQRNSIALKFLKVSVQHDNKDEIIIHIANNHPIKFTFHKKLQKHMELAALLQVSSYLKRAYTT